MQKSKGWMDVTGLLHVAFPHDKYMISEASVEAPGSLGQNSLIYSTLVLV